MSFKALADDLVTAGFSAFGEPATVTARGGAPVPASAIIDRGAEVLDDYGVVVSTRIEIELRNSEAGDIGRGTIVTDDDSGDSFQLLEPVSDNGDSSRWVASEV